MNIKIMLKIKQKGSIHMINFSDCDEKNFGQTRSIIQTRFEKHIAHFLHLTVVVWPNMACN